MVLGLADLLTPAFVLVAAALGGIIRPNDQVMRNALIGDTIPREHLMGAVGMSRTTMDSARVAGALAGATLSAALGVGAAYVFVTIFYLTSLALTFGVSRGGSAPDPGAGPARGASLSLSRSSSWREMLDGLLYVWERPRMLATMWLAFLVNLTAYPATRAASCPTWRGTSTGRTPTGSAGSSPAFPPAALLGSIGMVVTGGPRHPERSMVIFTAIWYALLLAFGHASSMSAGMPLLVVTGIVQSVAMISMSASLLQGADDRFRGRVMGVRMLAVYGLPLGLMAAGTLVGRIGFAGTITVYSAIGLGLTCLIGTRWRASVWAHEPSAPLAR